MWNHFIISRSDIKMLHPLKLTPIFCLKRVENLASVNLTWRNIFVPAITPHPPPPPPTHTHKLVLIILWQIVGGGTEGCNEKAGTRPAEHVKGDAGRWMVNNLVVFTSYLITLLPPLLRRTLSSVAPSNGVLQYNHAGFSSCCSDISICMVMDWVAMESLKGSSGHPECSESGFHRFLFARYSGSVRWTWSPLGVWEGAISARKAYCWFRYSGALLLLLCSYQSSTLMSEAGGLWCFHNPPDSDMNHRIFNVRVLLFLHVYALSLIQRTIS